LVSRPANLVYLFGFTGSSGLALCLDGETRLLVDSRYYEQAENETCNCVPVLAGRTLESTLPSLYGVRIEDAVVVTEQGCEWLWRPSEE
jgi:Xaa-Pro aminopeptidase